MSPLSAPPGADTRWSLARRGPLVVQVLVQERLDRLDLAAVMDQANRRLGGVGAGDILGDESLEQRTKRRGHDDDPGRKGGRPLSAPALFAVACLGTGRKLPGQRGRSARGTTNSGLPSLCTCSQRSRTSGTHAPQWGHTLWRRTPVAGMKDLASGRGEVQARMSPAGLERDVLSLTNCARPGDPFPAQHPAALHVAVEATCTSVATRPSPAPSPWFVRMRAAPARR